MLLNILNNLKMKYEIQTKEYHWCHREDTMLKSKGKGECLGIHIIVTLNDRYKVSIIQAFDEAIGEFYGPDIWDIAFVDTICGWNLIPYFQTPTREILDTAYICDGYAIEYYIKKFIKDKNIKGDN